MFCVDGNDVYSQVISGSFTFGRAIFFRGELHMQGQTVQINLYFMCPISNRGCDLSLEGMKCTWSRVLPIYFINCVRIQDTCQFIRTLCKYLY